MWDPFRDFLLTLLRRALLAVLRADVMDAHDPSRSGLIDETAATVALPLGLPLAVPITTLGHLAGRAAVREETSRTTTSSSLFFFYETPP